MWSRLALRPHITGFMQLNPARGRKLVKHLATLRDKHNCRFMQLNPARGRKQTRKFEEEIIIL